MSTITFDTLKFVETLERAKMPREQASAIASAVQTSLAQTLTDKMDTFAAKTDASYLRKETDSNFDLLRKDIAAMEQRLEAKIDAQGNKLTIRMTGVLIATISVVGAMIRFWPQAS